MDDNIWLTIASCLVLAAVLFYRRFNWCYSLFCFLLAVSTYLYPIQVASALPYFSVVLLCYVVCLCGYSILRVDDCNVESNSSSPAAVYVGKRTSKAGMPQKNVNIGPDITARITALASQLQLSVESCEWIVAVKLPKSNEDESSDGSHRRGYNNDMNRYSVVQATSRATHKGPNRFPFRQTRIKIESDINRNYHLNHVGWCDYNPDTSFVISNQILIPGYPCCESAIDTALQLSSSTVYTYIRCTFLYRLHTVASYLLLLLGYPILYQCYYYQPVVMLPTLTALPIMAFVNFIAILEICVLQLGGQLVNEGTFNFAWMIRMENFCKIFHRCVASTVGNVLIIAMIVYAVTNAYRYAVDPRDVVDQTRKPGANGCEVMDTTVGQIKNSKIFGNDYGYLRRLAMAQTKDGLDLNACSKQGCHGGPWGIDDVSFLITKDTTYPILLEKHNLLRERLRIDWSSVLWKDLSAPLYSGLAACLYLCTLNDTTPLSINDQKQHWKKHFDKTERPAEDFAVAVKELEANTSVCLKDIDLFVVLDSSQSVELRPYQKAKKFIANLVKGFTIGENNVRVGLVIYSSTVRLVFDLDDSFDQTEVLERIENVPYLDEFTATGDAIAEMVHKGFTEATGMRPSQFAIPRVGIVLTDGKTNRGSVNVVTAAELARNRSIEMFAFGIGYEINETELQEIAGSEDRVFRIDSFANIDNVAALIAQGACTTSTKAVMNTTYKGNLTVDESRLFEMEIPEEGLTIQVNVTKGKATLYGSNDNTIPNSVLHEYMVPNIQGVSVIPIPYPTDVPKRGQDDNTKAFYCNLIGVEKTSFTFKITG